MTRDDIIRMAREAGMVPTYFNRATFDTEMSAYSPDLERFATLVAATEREACARVCEEFVMGSPFAAAIRARGHL